MGSAMSSLPPLPELKGSIVVDGERYTFDVLELFGTELRAYGDARAAAEREWLIALVDDMLRGIDAIPLIAAIRARGET